MRTPWISAYGSMSRFVPCGQMTLTSQPSARSARLSCQTRRSNGTERFSTRISACLPLPAKALVPLGGPARLGVREADEVDDGPVAQLGQRVDDDLRESPLVELAERLLGKGYDLKIYDSNVALSRLVGANREYIETQIPHLSSLLCDTTEQVISGSEVIVVGNPDPEFVDAVGTCGRDQIVIDLVRLPIVGSLLEADYRGICW